LEQRTWDAPVVMGLVWFTNGSRMEEETGAEVFGKKAHHFFRKAWYSLSD
jgi:hypothetical protein